MSGRPAAVLVGVDGHSAGWAALAWAAAEAAATDRPLRIVHVVAWPVVADAPLLPPLDRVAAVRDAGELVLDEAVRRAGDVAPQLRIVTQLAADTRPGPAIVRAAGHDAVIVLGAGRIPRFRLGASIAAYVTRHAPCPVVIVGGSADAARNARRPVFVVSRPAARPPDRSGAA